MDIAFSKQRHIHKSYFEEVIIVTIDRSVFFLVEFMHKFINNPSFLQGNFKDSVRRFIESFRGSHNLVFKGYSTIFSY